MAQTLIRPSQIWNVPSAANLSSLLKCDGTEVTVSNTVVETQLWTYTIPANTLTANDSLKYEMYMSVLNNSGAGQQYTIRVKLGGTTILSIVNGANVAASATTWGLVLHAMIKNAGATNSQKAVGDYVIGSAAANIGSAYGTAAIDTTANAVFTVTLQCSSATATQTLIHLMSVLTYQEMT